MARRTDNRLEQRNRKIGGPAKTPNASLPYASDTPLLEWIVAAIGIALVSAVMGFLIYGALSENREAPSVTIIAGEPVRSGDGYLVPLIAENRGGATAAGVVIEGELRSDNSVIERSETTADYLPPQSKKRLGLFFSRDPRQFELKVRPLGYADP